MATALQCPECGFKHRLAAIGDRSVFPCSSCGRQLKVPQEYRPASVPAANGGSTGGSAAAGAGRRAGTRTAPRRPKHQVGAAPMRLPVRILLWVVAFVLGAVVVRALAKWTGFAGGDTFFDLLIDGSIGTYLRLFALVPVWALFATLLATALIDGPRAWARRRSGSGSGRMGASAAASAAAAAGGAGAAKARRPARVPKAGPKDVPAGAAAGAGAVRATQRSIPRRDAPAATAKPRPPVPTPEPEPTLVVPPPAARTAAAPVVGSEPADDPDAELAARVAAGQRPRRIPRRGDGS
jgi:hypothetical protein